MVNTLAQLIALVAHGNAFLAGGYDRLDFYPNNSAFQYCTEVVFVHPKTSRLKSVHVDKDPFEWLGFLKGINCRRLSLGYQTTQNSNLPDHISVAFVGGGGTSYIFADSFKQSSCWFGRWEPASRGWKVTYTGMVAKGVSIGGPSGDLEGWKGKLRAVLERAEAFAASHQASGFAGCFRRGLDALDSRDPMSLVREEEWLPKIGYSLAARQLFAAACQSWVFGGMGSWNDLGFEDRAEQEKYEALSTELYSTIISAIEQSVNSFSAP